MFNSVFYVRTWTAVAVLSTACFFPHGECRAADVFLGNGANDIHAEDRDGDDIFLVANGDTIAGVPDQALVGDIESDFVPRELRYLWGYDLNASAQTSIAGADIVSLDLTLDFVGNPIPGTSLDIYAVSGRNATTELLEADYAGGTLLINDAFFGTDLPGTRRSFDITTFAQAEIGLDSGDDDAFILVARFDDGAGGATLPNGNVANNFFALATPDDLTDFPTLTSSQFPVGGEIDIFADVNDTRNLEDFNPNDDIADNAAGTGGFLLPGDIESDGNPREIRTTLGFELDLVSQAAINTPGAQVILAVQAIQSDPEITELDLYGLDGKTSTVGDLGDYAAGTLLADALFDGTGDSGAQKVVDVTAFALANAANGALTFKFQGDGITLPNLDGNNDFWQITTPGAAQFEPLLRIILPAVLAGDFDTDGDVDGADFLEWQRGFGTIYDASDLADWEASFGAPTPLASATAAVPEPTSLALLVLGMSGGLAAGRRRHRS